MPVRPARSTTGAALTLGALVAIAALTLRSAPDQVLDAVRTPLDCLVCGDVGGADVLLNLALFLPLGLGLGVLRRTLRTATAFAFLVSLTVELLQYTVVVGRDASLSDLLTNTAGGALGWLLVTHGARLVRPAPVTARRLAALATAVWLAAYAASAAALHPAAAGGGYWGQWAHDFPLRGTWAGRIVGVRLNELSLPDGPLSITPLVHRRIASGEFDLVVQATSGRRVEENAQIFGLANDSGDIFLEWRQKETDYEFAVRGRAGVLRLRSPTIVVRSAAPADAGVPIAFTLGWHHGVMTAAAVRARGAERVERVLAPSMSWTFLWPWETDLGRLTGLASALWLVVTLAPAGFWAALGGRAATGVAAVAIVLGMVLLPPSFGLRFTPPLDWLGAAIGLGLGVGLARLSRSRRWPPARAPRRHSPPARPG